MNWIGSFMIQFSSCCTERAFDSVFFGITLLWFTYLFWISFWFLLLHPLWHCGDLDISWVTIMVAKTIVPHKLVYQVWNINCHLFCTDVHKATIVYLSLLLFFLEKSFVIEKKALLHQNVQHSPQYNRLLNATSFMLLETVQKIRKTNFVVFKSKATVKQVWDYIWTDAFVDTVFLFIICEFV